MKHSKPLSALILIASVLLLSGASSSPKPSPVPSPRQSVQTKGQSSNAPKSEEHEAVPVRVAPVDVNRNKIDYVNPILTFLLVLVGAAYAILARCQLRAIGRQADIAENTLTETSRPWVYPELTVVSDGLRYPNGVARIVLRVTLKNTGHSVAVDTRVYMKMLLYIGGEEPVDKQLELIDAIGNGPQVSRPYGIALFPGETNTLQDQELIIPHDEIERCMRGPSGAIHPTIVGFVDYKFPFPSKIESHETRFIYEMERRTGDRMTTPNAYSDIPSGELAFFPSFNGGHEVK
jgi:hypothetical protein